MMILPSTFLLSIGLASSFLSLALAFLAGGSLLLLLSTATKRLNIISLVIQNQVSNPVLSAKPISSPIDDIMRTETVESPIESSGEEEGYLSDSKYCWVLLSFNKSHNRN